MRSPMRRSALLVSSLASPRLGSWDGPVWAQEVVAGKAAIAIKIIATYVRLT